VAANVALPTCQVLDLVARIVEADVQGGVTIVANDDDAVCP
jgi:hypothetical protein